MSLKRVAFLLLTMIFMALTGCHDQRTPKDTLGAAVEALKKNDLKNFKKTLSGSAREIYGNPDGMGSLRQILNGRAAGDVQLVVLKKEKETRLRKVWYQARVFDVANSSRPALNATILCHYSYFVPSPHNGIVSTQIHCTIDSLTLL